MVTQGVTSSFLCKWIRHEKSIAVFMGYAHRRWIFGFFANIVSKQVTSKRKAKLLQEYNTKSFTLSGKCLQINNYATLNQLFNFRLAKTEISLMTRNPELWFEFWTHLRTMHQLPRPLCIYEYKRWIQRSITKANFKASLLEGLSKTLNKRNTCNNRVANGAKVYATVTIYYYYYYYARKALGSIELRVQWAVNCTF
jgi:hypothetical protein